MAKTKDKKKNKGGDDEKRNVAKPEGPIGPKMFKGLNEGRMKSGVGRFADRTKFVQGDTIDVQFLDLISEFVEYDQHQFRDGGKWKYVPCGGDNCPLCADDDSEVSKTHYRFSCNVYNHDTKRVEVFEGPKTLSALISKRYGKVAHKAKGDEDKLRKLWTNSVWEMSKMKTQPVSFDVDEGDSDPVTSKRWEGKTFDLQKNIIEQFKFYFGDDVDIRALDAKEDTEAKSSMDDDGVTKKELKEMDDDALKKVGKSFGIKSKGMTKKEFIDAILEAQ